MVQIRRLSAAEAEGLLDELAGLLQDSVGSGASVGYLPPLSTDEAGAYWREILREMSADRRVLVGAFDQGRVVGAVQLHLEGRPNGSHRGEVNKLLVHTAWRRRGIGRELMKALEGEARLAGRTLLVLDTRAGDSAEGLYRELGYQAAGRIPGYARIGEGGLDATVFMYKQLE